MSTTLLLIRHGETTWNRERRIQGQRDVPLSPKGEQQSRHLGPVLAAQNLGAVYSSDSSRALETARLATDKLSFAIQTSPELRERNFGEWEGHSWDEIEKLFPQEAKAFFDNSVSFTAPGGESWNQMQSRVFSKLRDTAARHQGQIVAVFTHGGPCKAAVFEALQIPPGTWRQWVVANASIQKLVWDGAAWKLAGFNNTSHLSGDEDQMADPSSLKSLERAV